MSAKRPIDHALAGDASTTAALPFDLLDAWGGLWLNRAEPYALQQEDGTYRWIYASCDATVLGAHLAGEATLAPSSLGEDGACRWLCLDADAVGALPHLLELAAALAELGLPGLVEASRRGGHLWLLLDAPVAAALARRVLLHELEGLRTIGLQIPECELYPDLDAAGALGHAVRLPLGIHRLTGRRYALFDAWGHPCAFTSPEAAVRFVLAWPRISSVQLVRRAGELLQVHQEEREEVPSAGEMQPSDGTAATQTAEAASPPLAPIPIPIGTRSAVIRWVDNHVAIPELLAELAPMTELKKVGRGYLGWCPFHDDRAPDVTGRPGTPSFYAVRDRHYGWSWRCFSTNCVHSVGPLRHSFRLLQDLLELTVSQAIREACARWPEADAQLQGEEPRGEGEERNEEPT
jgi:hypothetical protein